MQTSKSLRQHRTLFDTSASNPRDQIPETLKGFQQSKSTRPFSGAMQGNRLPKEAAVRENTPRIQIHHRRTKLHSVSSRPPTLA